MSDLELLSTFSMIDEIDEDTPVESPINLNISKMIRINLNRLLWYNYEIVPQKITLTNTGKTVIVSGEWPIDRPYLSSGPLATDYLFSQFHFHWGPNDMIGSEHFIDGGSQSMELHAVHFKKEYRNHEFAMTQIDGIVIIVYLLKLQTEANLPLNDVVKFLPSVHQPHSSISIAIRPLIDTLRPFVQDYFVYRGVIINGDKSHWIKWLISREPIGISLEQTAEFRKLNDRKFKPNLNNCETLRDGKNARVFHVNPSGFSYATLLRIPHDRPMLIESQRDLITKD